MNCVMGALDKIHQLIQIKAVGFTLFWSILCFCHRTSPVLAGLHLDHDHKVRPTLNLAKA